MAQSSLSYTLSSSSSAEPESNSVTIVRVMWEPGRSLGSSLRLRCFRHCAKVSPDPVADSSPDSPSPRPAQRTLPRRERTPILDARSTVLTPDRRCCFLRCCPRTSVIPGRGTGSDCPHCGDTGRPVGPCHRDPATHLWSDQADSLGPLCKLSTGRLQLRASQRRLICSSAYKNRSQLSHPNKMSHFSDDERVPRHLTRNGAVVLYLVPQILDGAVVSRLRRLVGGSIRRAIQIATQTGPSA